MSVMERKQIFAWTGPTPKDGYAPFVQVFEHDDSSGELVVRGTDGESVTWELTGADLASMGQAVAAHLEARNASA